MTSAPSVTIGVVPRERFSLAAEAIERIVEHTSVPYRLVVVDTTISGNICVKGQYR